MKPSMRDIEWIICRKFSVSSETLRRKRRGAKANPLHIALFLTREMTTKSYSQIGALFCRDHTTVMYAVRRIARLIDVDPKLAQLVDECRDAAMFCVVQIVRVENKHVALELG